LPHFLLQAAGGKKGKLLQECSSRKKYQ
jgi:hypothetical protein